VQGASEFEFNPTEKGADMSRKLIFAATLAGALAAAGAALADSSVSNITNRLMAAPRMYRGQCPAVITFDGTITVAGRIDPSAPVEIGYQFLRSDNAKGPIMYFNVTRPGTTPVSTTWTLGGAALPAYSGWEQLKAWPTRHEGGFGYAFSGRAGFRVVCIR
jgi:hypothetical protein